MTSIAARLPVLDEPKPVFPGFAVSVLVAATAQFLRCRRLVALQWEPPCIRSLFCGVIRQQRCKQRGYPSPRRSGFRPRFPRPARPRRPACRARGRHRPAFQPARSASVSHRRRRFQVPGVAIRTFAKIGDDRQRLSRPRAALSRRLRARPPTPSPLRTHR